MDGWLKALIATACSVVIVGGGWLAYDALAKARSAEQLEQQSRDRHRSLQLAEDGCRSQVDELLRRHKTDAIKVATDVPTELAHDIGICIRDEIMFAYEKHQLDLSSLTDIFKSS